MIVEEGNEAIALHLLCRYGGCPPGASNITFPAAKDIGKKVCGNARPAPGVARSRPCATRNLRVSVHILRT